MDINDYRTVEPIHLVYFDSFVESATPDMWHPQTFETIYNALPKNGCLMTVSAKGSFKRLLKQIGFQVESLPGPPGKREISKAAKE
jgi:tRNA U34 5-methylaminomethyl-2-thiouridine-forming methyltransferase MnmC